MNEEETLLDICSISKEQIIFRVLCAKNYLEQVLSYDVDIFPFYKGLMDYLKEKCPHKIINDSIDTTPEKTTTIRYCSYCYLRETDILDFSNVSSVS